MTDMIFKYVSHRPPQLLDEETVESTFAAPKQLEPAGNVEFLGSVGDELYEFAVRFIASDDYTPDDPSVRAVVASAIAHDGLAAQFLEDEFGTSVGDFLSKQDITLRRARLWGSYYAHVVANDVRPEARAAIADSLRCYHFLELVALGVPDEKLPTAESLARVRILIPRGLVSPEPAVEIDPAEGKAALADQLEDLADRAKKALAVCRDLDRDPVTVPQITPVVARTVTQAASWSAPRWLGAIVGARATWDAGRIQVAVDAGTPWFWSQDGRGLLSKTTIDFLDDRPDLRLLTAEEICERLSSEVRKDLTRLLDDISKEEHGYLATLDSYSWLRKYFSVPSMYGQIMGPPYFPTPTDRGIRPLGIGDLMVVEQELLYYAAGEVAHIENVMATEERERNHSRLRETEEIFITETERLEETEKDLQTTERFELHNEAESTINTEMTVEAGVEVSASYGMVKVTAHGDFALSRSQSESMKSSSDFAREVTARARSRLVERARQERTRRTLERFEETNRHAFINTNQGAQHIRGVYRWVDKYYKVRLVNYGRRLLMEFVVPEPAAFYIHVASGQSVEVPMPRPNPPIFAGRALEPGDLSRSTVDGFVADYNVPDVLPYPEPTLRLGASFAQAPAAGQNENVGFGVESDKFVVPNGYQANGGYSYIVNSAGWDGYFSDVYVAGRPANGGTLSLNGLTGSIPVSAAGWAMHFHFNMTYSTSVTTEKVHAWKLDTFEKIMTAYQLAEQRYQEAVSAAEIAQGVEIEGRNPEINRKIEREELQRAVLYLLTNDFQETVVGGETRLFERFDAMRDFGPFGYPSFDMDESIIEGRITQFFELAFEWPNMTYVLYPYFWGRMEDWDETFDRLNDPDPLFAHFLRSGSARVVVPVRPAYTDAMLYYLETNTIWNGGEPPTINDPLYVSIVDEIRSRSDEQLENPPRCVDEAELHEGAAIHVTFPCIADEWEVKVPTTLVWLQEDGELPDNRPESQDDV